MSHTDVDRLRRQVIDPQKDDLKSIPVASDRPIEEQIMNVNVSLYIRKLIDVVKTNLFLHYITEPSGATVVQVHFFYRFWV